MMEPAKRRGRPPKVHPDATPVRVLAPSLWWGGVRYPEGAIVAVDDPAPLIERGQVEVA